MICDKCQTKQANVNVYMNVNGKKKQLKLCYDCYQAETGQQGQSFSSSNQHPSLFQGFPFEDLFDSLSHPNHASAFKGAENAATTKTKQPAQGGGGFIDHFGTNITQMARAGLIDPVIGREKEVNRVIEILNRRNKNNPVLIGEPGVGKTAIAEALALTIVTGKGPKKLQNKEVYLLDVATLVANTGIRGQFEQRMKQLIAELKQRKNIILFIDEIHLIVGAGSAEGSMDAGNILKPALARGEIQVVGATTLAEYRQIEKDAALERRFQPVHVHEPSLDATIAILNGLKQKYEDYHEVDYSKDAIRSCVQLSSRYIQDRFLPDKAIDLMDEAGSRLNLTAGSDNKNDIEQRLAAIEREKATALEQENYELAAKLRDEEEQLEKRRRHLQSSQRQSVTTEMIEEIVAEKTGIPVGKIHQDEQKNLASLEEEMSSKVIGQDEAVTKVAKAIRRGRAGLKAAGRPIGSFLFVGPTGVGKTELTKVLAENMFGTKDAMIRLDMSEYMEKHSVSKLIGSPPGYVGHEEAGQLTENVRRHPYSIILLDEIEKAHPDVQHIFLQILEDGHLTDSQGRTVSFKETVIIMTSNAGTGYNTAQVGFNQSNAIKEANILDSLGDFFKPEFLNRFDNIIEFKPLSKASLAKIVELMLTELKENLAERDITLAVSDEVMEKLIELGYHPSFGARPLRRVIQEQLEDQIADFILDQPEEKDLIATVEKNKIIVHPR